MGRRLAGVVAAVVMALAAPAAQAQTTPPPYTFTGGTALGTAPNPWYVTFNKAGNLMAVVNVPLNATSTSTFSISMFTVGGNGFLSPVAGSPFVVNGVVNAVAFNESGTLLAATNGVNSFLIFSVAPTGALTLLSTTSTVGEVTIPISVAFSSTGLLAVAYAAGNGVATYSVSPTGEVSQLGIGLTGSVLSSPQTVAFNPSGSLLALANSGTDDVSVFSVAADGALTLVGNFSTGEGSGPVSATFSPNGQLLMTANQTTERIGVFSVAANGALSQIPGSPFAASPSTNASTRHVTFHPSGSLIAIANPNSHNVRLMSVAANGALGVVQDIESPFVPVSVAFSPHGGFLAAALAGVNTVFMHRVGPPKVTFLSLTEGASIGPAPPGFPWKSTFTCSDAVYGPGIVSCLDQDGNPSGAVIDTSVPGERTLTVTATSIIGRTTTSSITYTVIPGPTATITSPAGGGTYVIGEVVPTAFSCASAASGPNVVLCQDSNGVSATSSNQPLVSGTGALKTATAGTHTYTVNGCAGSFCAGGFGSASITYTVIEEMEATTLSAPALPAAALAGSAVTATTTLARADGELSGVSGHSIVFTWTLPGGGTVSQTAITAADGTASVSFTPAARGVHSVSASFAGSATLVASSSAAAALSAYQKTMLHLPAGLTVPAGAATSISATLVTLPGGAPVAGETVSFVFSGAAGAPAPQTAVTNASGVATVSVVFPMPGTVTADVSFLNAAAFYTNSAGALPADAENASATITVSDATPPVIAFHPDLTAPATSGAGATVTYTAPPAHDAIDGDVPVLCSPASGSTFPIGSTTVSCTASDSSGNGASSSFTVTVLDTAAPVVTYTGNAGTYRVDQTVAITCAATDAGSGVAATTCADIAGPAYSFGLGTHTFSATATDAAGNVGHGSTTFTVVATPASLQAVVVQMVTNAGVASGLNAKLAAAAKAPNARARDGQLGAFANQLRGQVGRTISAADAAVLMALVDALY